MAFAVRLVEVRGLRGRYDRVAKLTFRDKTKSTDVYEFCYDANWDEEFDWQLEKALKPSDYIEIQILNYNRLWKSRCVARYQMYLKKLLNEPYIKITEHLVDNNSTILNAMITFEVLLSDVWPRELTFQEFHPVEEKMRVLEDWELESRKSGGSRFSLTSSMKRKLGSITSLTSSKRALLEMGTVDPFDEMGNDNVNIKLKKKDVEKPKEKEKFNLHPKVRVRLKAQREEIDFNVQIRLIEGKQFAGTQLDPVCDVHCFGDKKSSQVKEQTNTPYWDEFFVFDTIGQRDMVFDEIIEFKVYSGRNLISKGNILGTFKIDLGTIYSQPDHRFIRKFACLTNPDETLGASGAGIKGYLKLDITVLAKGDPVKEPPNTKDDDDVDENALLPENVKPERLRQRFCVRIYKAEGLPKMNSGILAQIRKQFTGEARIRDLADPYVYVHFAGMEASTSVKPNSYDPEWVEEIIFCDLFPSLCRRIKIQLRDKDVTKTETIGTCWIDLSEISNDGCNVNKFSLNSGFMPTFGPTWLNLYGSTRDYQFIDQNNFLNEGKEEGIGYRGRVLLAVQCEEGESATDDQIANIHVKGAVPVSDVVGGKEDNFQLYCCIHEASMIDRNTAKKPIQFEMNIGNYGNTFDGKMLSSKDDDEEEDEEDRFTHPLTDPVMAETLDREYYNMPFYEEKPCLHLRFPWEDHRKRLYLQNMILKCVYSLEDALEDVDDRINIDADNTYEYLQDALKEFTGSCQKLLDQLGGKVTGPKAGRTKLDKERMSLFVSETKQIMDETKQILDGLKDNKRIRSNYSYVLSLRDRMTKLAREPQAVVPDVFIWLLSGGKRMSYVRIQPHDIMYSPVIWESGTNAGKLHTYLLTLPGKSGLGENGWAIKCKLTCVLWLGVLKNKKDMFNGAPEGFELPKGLTKSTAPPPEVLKYAVSEKYVLRAHAYQARGLIGSDDSGLSDAFARVIFDNQAGDTSVVWETRSPTWNQTLMFYDIVIWGSIDAVVENPPTIMIEIFDYDDGGDIEFIGRAMARPLVKRAEEPYDQPLFPPKLEWFPIYRGDNAAGEILAAFELFQVTGDEEQDIHLPPPPPEMEDKENGGSFFMVPDDIRPVMAPHRIECLFWGVREMKKISFQAVDHPQVEFECVGESVKSLIIPSAKLNPNFPEPWTYFDLDLPEEDRYCPPLTISLRDTRMFGKEILVGTCIVNSLLKYLQDSSAYGEEGEGTEEAKDEGETKEGDENNAEGETDENGLDNEGLEGDDVPLLGSRSGSKAPSIAGSKAVSFAAGSKPPSMKGTPKRPSRGATPAKSLVLSAKGTPSKLSVAKQSIASRRRSTNPNMNATPVRKSRRMSTASFGQSSQIHYHIVSNPGRLEDTPLKKIFTPRKPKEKKKKTPKKNLEETVSKADSNKVTPFKQLMEKPPVPATPSKSIGGESVNLNDIDAVVDNIPIPDAQKPTSRRGSFIEQIKTPIKSLATPIKSIGSRIVSPVQSLTASRRNSKTPPSPGKQWSDAGSVQGSKAGSMKGSHAGSIRGTPIGSQAGSIKGSKRGSIFDDAENIEMDDLELGAEAGDFGDDQEFVREEGDGAEAMDGLETDEELEETGDEGVEGEEGEGDAAEENKESAEAAPPPMPTFEDDEDAEDEEVPEMKVIMVGEDDLKAEQEAAQLEAAEEEEDEDEEDEEDEDQIDWWARFYETIKDDERAEEEKAAALKKRKKADAKKGKKTVQLDAEEGEEEEEIDTGGKKKKIINPKIIRVKIYKTELEEVPAFDGFNDVVHSFTLLRGKSDGNDDEDESRIYGKFKGTLKVWKYPFPSLFEEESSLMGSFKMLPTMDPVNILCRVYIVKAIDLHPTDMDGKADPYVRLQIGKQVIKDSENYVPKQLNPSFGRVFDFEVIIPHNNMLTIGVYDFDLVGTHELIGETKIDIENRFFSKHRATCGMSVQYAINGFNKWRDPIKPTAILQRLCKDHKLDGPHFTPGKCRVNKWVFCAQDHIMDDNGNPKQSDEPSALKALHYFHMIEGKGYPLVPEHVETRSLLTPKIPGIEQGRLQLWVDLFDMDGPSPGASIDITPRKPTAYELRVIIWNTEDVTLGDINILTGQPCADIYVKGWIDGIKDNKQQTDVHGTSLTGEGNFNWRFIFPFKYHKAEEKVVIIKKASLFSWDTTEERMPPRLNLFCFDSDALSSDDLLGSLMLNLTAIPRPAKTSVQCGFETMNNENKDSIFKKKLLKGWWPFILNEEDSEPEIGGKVEAQLELFTEQEAEEDPAGLGRKEPNPLPFPDRPDIMMQWMMNPLKALRYFLWEQYKFCLAKFVVIGIIFAIMGLFFYSMPGTIVQKLFGG